MIKRFFSLFFKGRTYEITPELEWARLLLIQYSYIYVMRVLLFLKLTWSALSVLIVVFVVVHWWYYSRLSIGHLVQIADNKKNAIFVNLTQLYDIQKAYPKDDLYILTRGDYLRIKSGHKAKIESDVVLLILVGNNPLYEKKKIKKIISDKTIIKQ